MQRKTSAALWRPIILAAMGALPAACHPPHCKYAQPEQRDSELVCERPEDECNTAYDCAPRWKRGDVKDAEGARAFGYRCWREDQGNVCVEGIVAAAEARVPAPNSDDDDDGLIEHGLIGRRSRAELRRSVLNEVVLPCAARLTAAAVPRGSSPAIHSSP
jgi:hypothetical protein